MPAAPHSARPSRPGALWRAGLRRARTAPGRWVPAVVVSAAATLAASGAAFAFWSASGAGTTGNDAATMTLTVNALTGADLPTGALLPGGVADAVVSVTNPNAYPVSVERVQARGPVTADNGCAPTGVGFENQTGLAVSVDAGATLLVHLDGAVTMDATSAAACQGAAFAIPVTVTVRR